MAPVPERLAATPDAYRTRAFSSAGLVSTGAAAIAAGAIFGGISRIPAVAALAAVIALTLLLGSVAFYTAAGLYARTADVPNRSDEETIKSIVGSIVTRMKFGSGLALS